MAQIDIATVISVFAIVASLGSAAYFGVSRYAQHTRDSEVNRRLLQAETNIMEMIKSVHSDELETVRLQGKLALVEQHHTSLETDLDEIKKLIVPRTEWETSQRNLTGKIDDLTREVRSRVGGRYSTTSSDPAVPAVRPGEKR
jgi:hypothetical protein